MIVERTDSAYGKMKTSFGEVKSNGKNIKIAMEIPLLNSQVGADWWKGYIKAQNDKEEFPDDVIEEEIGIYVEELGHLKLKSEYKRALEDLKSNKAEEG